MKKKMTMAQFWAALKQAGSGWVLTDVYGTSVRCKDGLCPILAVYRLRGETKYTTNWDVFEAGAWLGLSFRQANAIVSAADNNKENDTFKASTRKKLLKTVGLA